MFIHNLLYPKIKYLEINTWKNMNKIYYCKNRPYQIEFKKLQFDTAPLFFACKYKFNFIIYLFGQHYE